MSPLKEPAHKSLHSVARLQFFAVYVCDSLKENSFKIHSFCGQDTLVVVHAFWFIKSLPRHLLGSQTTLDA